MAKRQASDLGFGILFSVGVSGQRNLLLLTSAMEAVRASAMSAGFDMVGLGRSATTAVVGLGILMASVNSLKASLNLAEEVADFDYQMRHITALSTQYGEDISGMTDDILAMSMAYGKSALDIAEVQKELIRTGRGPAEAMGMTSEIMELSLIGELTPQDATDTMLSVMNSMNLAADQAGNVTDMLAYAANQGWVTVGDFAEGFSRFGALGGAMNQSMEELIATYIMMKDQGISSARAATMMRMMYTRLRAPSSQAAALLQDLDIEIYEVGGAFRSVMDIIADVQSAVQVGDVSEGVALSALTGEDLQQMYMEEGQHIRTILSQRPMLGYDIITGAMKDDLLGVEVGKALIENIRDNHEGYAEVYLNDIQNSFTFHKNQLTETWNAIKYKVGLPMLKIFHNILQGLKPMVEKLYEIVDQNPKLAETAAHIAVIAPILGAIGGVILLIKGIVGVKAAIDGLKGLKAVIATLSGTGAATSGKVATAAVVAKTSILGVIGTVLLAVAAVIGLIFIIKWIVEAVKFYGNDISTFVDNFFRLQLNTVIGVANVLAEVFTAVVTTVVFALRWMLEAIEWIYNAIPGNDADLTGWMGETDSWAGARKELFGQFGFMEYIGYQDYQTPEGSRADSSGLLPGQADNLAGIREQQRLIQEGYRFGGATSAPQEESSKTPAVAGGFSLGSLNVTINAEGITNPEGVGKAVVDALSAETKRGLI